MTVPRARSSSLDELEDFLEVAVQMAKRALLTFPWVE